MTAFVLFNFDMTDQEVAHAHGGLVMQTAPDFGGEVVCPPSQMTTLEGESRQHVGVLMKFDSTEKANAWYNSAAYQAGKQVRDGKLNMSITVLG